MELRLTSAVLFVVWGFFVAVVAYIEVQRGTELSSLRVAITANSESVAELKRLGKDFDNLRADFSLMRSRQEERILQIEALRSLTALWEGRVRKIEDHLERGALGPTRPPGPRGIGPP